LFFSLVDANQVEDVFNGLGQLEKVLKRQIRRTSVGVLTTLKWMAAALNVSDARTVPHELTAEWDEIEHVHDPYRR
jgi:hypothetical protein